MTVPEGINISLAEVTAAATTLRATNTSLDEKLRAIKSLMDKTQEHWQSDAGNTIRERFNALLPRFDQYRDVIEAYAKFLDTTVVNYDATETSVNSAASSFA